MRLISQILLLSTGLLLGACKPSERPVDQASREGILLIGNAAEPASLDPQRASGVQEGRILLALFEGLVTLHPKTLAPEAAAASHWDISEDACTYTFYLRPEARWSNGDPLLASDFSFAFERLLNPNSLSAHAQLLKYIIGASDYSTGKLTDFSQVGIHVIDPHTLVFHLKEPLSYFLNILAYHPFVPLHPATLKVHPENWTQTAILVSNGPFSLKNWQINQIIEVQKNPHYWNKENVRLNGIHFFPIEDSKTEERAFEAGQLHITSRVRETSMSRYIKTQSPYLRNHPYFSTAFYLINTEHPPLGDVRVRQALNLTINREAISSQLLHRGQKSAYGLVPPGLLGYPYPKGLEQNIDKAKKLLSEAGYPEGKGFPSLELSYNTSEERQLIAQAIQNMWKTHLGIDVQLNNQEWKSFLDKRRQGDFDLCRGDWVGDYNDPSAFLDLFLSNAPFNAGNWQNTQYNEYIKEADNQKDANKRLQNLSLAESILIEDAAIIPLYFLSWSALVQTNVQGWYNNALDYHPYSTVSLTD